MKSALDELMYLGYTTQTDEGAIANGTRVRKVNSEAGDGHQDGALGIVLGSLPGSAELLPEQTKGKPFYFVEWDSHRGLPVGILGWKIEPVEGVE